MAILSILSDDLIQYLICQWISKKEELIGLDIALCNRSLRSRYLPIPKQISFMIQMKTKDGMEKLCEYSRTRFISWRIMAIQLSLCDLFMSVADNKFKKSIRKLRIDNNDSTTQCSLSTICNILSFFMNLDYFLFRPGVYRGKLVLTSDTLPAVEAPLALTGLHLHDQPFNMQFFLWLAKACPKLHKLGLTGPSTHFVLPILHRFTQLEDLKIYCGDRRIPMNTWTPTTTDPMISHPSSTLTSLESLRYFITSHDEEIVRTGLQNIIHLNTLCPTIKHLFIDFCMASMEEISPTLKSTYLDIFRTWTALESLRLQDHFRHGIYPSDFLQQYIPFPTIQRLTNLELYHLRSFDDVALEYLSRYAVSLQSLKLMNVDITVEGMEQFCATFQSTSSGNEYHGYPQLTTLELCTNVSEEVFRMILFTPATQSRLQRQWKEFSYKVTHPTFFSLEALSMNFHQYMLQYHAVVHEQLTSWSCGSSLASSKLLSRIVLDENEVNCISALVSSVIEQKNALMVEEEQKEQVLFPSNQKKVVMFPELTKLELVDMILHATVMRYIIQQSPKLKYLHINDCIIIPRDGKVPLCVQRLTQFETNRTDMLRHFP